MKRPTLRIWMIMTLVAASALTARGVRDRREPPMREPIGCSLSPETKQPLDPRRLKRLQERLQNLKYFKTSSPTAAP